MTTGFTRQIWNEIAAFSNEQDPEAEWIELHQYLSRPVIGPFSGERTNNRSDRTVLILPCHPAIHFGKNSFPRLHYRHHFLQSVDTDTFSKVLSVNHNHVSPIDSASSQRWHTCISIDLQLAETLSSPSLHALSSVVNDLWKKSKCPKVGPYLKDLPE